MNKDNSQNDYLLWNSFLSGNREAYELIYKNYVYTLFSYGLQFSSDRELVKDCIQDVFEKLHKNREKLKSTDNIKAYLFAIMKNSMINLLKKEQTYLQYIGGLQEEETSTELSAHEKWESKENEVIMKSKIRHVLSLLTPRQKEAIYYRYMQGMDISEIAGLMNSNYQSVQNLIQRSFKKIREDMSNL